MKRKLILVASLVLLAITAFYSNHFLTDLHYSDYTTVRDNPAIRSLLDIPRFFLDSSTASTIPSEYFYRPVVTTSLAIDYSLGKGAPFFYHFLTFVIFLAGMATVGWMFFLIFEQIIPYPWNAYLAIMGAALLGVHPAVAELMNAVSRRGDLYADLCVVAGVALYAGLPDKRRLGLYLIPPFIGILADPSALIFGPMLLAYILLIEPAPVENEPLSEDQIRSRDQTVASVEKLPSGSRPKRIRIRRRKHPFRRYVKAQLKRFTPSLAFTTAACAFELLINPFNPLGERATNYWFTQPWAAWRYFRSFFAPFYLGPASDLTVFVSYDIRAVWGLAFLIGLISLALLLAVSREWRPVVFGLWWFILGILPNAIVMQSEVEADTRMFLPFIGLALSVTWTARMLLPSGKPWRRLEAILASLVLLALGCGTFARNRVWSSEETLWHDTIQKHPASVRGLQNYAVALESRGRAADAYEYLWKAHKVDPQSAEVEAHMGSVAAALGRTDEAEEHFRHAMYLRADESICQFLYGVFLEKEKRRKDALEAYSWASSLAHTDLRPRYGMMRLYIAGAEWGNLRRAVEEAQEISRNDRETLPFAGIVRDHPDTINGLEQMVKDHPTPESHLELAEAYCMAGEYTKCLESAQKALQLRPGYVAAYIDRSAAYISLGRLDEAIDSSRKALEFDPDNKVARDNVRLWEGQKLVVGNAIMRK